MNIKNVFASADIQMKTNKTNKLEFIVLHINQELLVLN